jgi:signal transduction histidine kinase
MPEPTRAQLLAEVEALRKALKRSKAKLKAEAAARQQLATNLTEAREQQTATSEILRVISSSPTDYQPVFDTIVRNAGVVCGANDAILWTIDGDELVMRSHHGPLGGAVGFRQPIQGSVAGYAVSQARVVHIEDVTQADDFPIGRDIAHRLGYRAVLSAPLLRESVAIGALLIRRMEARRFSDQQIALLQTFADQAVIAIENVRLFTELQHKNEALTQTHAQVTEALEQQTATSEILRVIASSPTDVQPVFDAVAESAARLCDSSDAEIFRRDGDRLLLVAHHGPIPSGTLTVPLVRGTFNGRAVLDRCTVHVADLQRETDEFPQGVVFARQNNTRGQLVVPMLREGVAIGTISLRRVEARLFTERQVALLQTFADQAVIAVENVRLFTELQTSNRELTTALDTQTATSDILRVISRSQTDVQPVFDAILASAVRLLRAYTGLVTQIVGDQVELAALFTSGEGDDAALRALFPRPLESEGPNVRAIRDRVPLNIADAATDPRLSESGRSHARLRQYRSVIVVPLLRHDEAIGTIVVTRRDAGGFTDDEIALLQTFADQAVIAIENARLLTELQARTRELEVASQHKSEFLASMSHELRTPLNAVIGFSDVLLQGMFGETNEKQTEYLRDILASGQHLLSLINDILDLSKIEAGRMDLDLAGFDVPSAIEDALLLMRERAGRRGLTLERHIDQGLGEIRADQRKVKQVLLNLLSNAVKFTPEGGVIDVRAVRVDGEVEIAVMDTGIGIAPEDQEAVFEEFRQVGKAEKKAEGTGLGLALCRKFVELHGGRIWVTSEVGKGSTFTFTIPVGGAPAPV